MKTNKKNLTKVLTLSVIILFAIFLVLSAANNLISTNIVYAQSPLAVIIEILIGLFDLFTFGICFSVFIYSIYRFGVKPTMPMVLIYSGFILVKDLVSITIACIMLSEAWTLEMLFYVLLLWVLETLFAFAIVLIAHLCTKNKESENLSFDKIYSKGNSVQNSALFTAAIISAMKLIERVILDIEIGAPKSFVDFLWMVAGYASDLISGVIVYLVCIFFIKKLSKKDNE